MIFKNNSIQILWRVSLIMINCFVLAFLFYNSQNYVIISHLFLLVIIQSWLLNQFLNKTFKNINLLLESYSNNDSMNLSHKKTESTLNKKIYDRLEEINNKVRQAEKELLKQLEYIHVVTKNIPGGLITILDDGKIDLYSKSVLDLVKKNKISSLNDFKDYAELFQTLSQLLPGEKKIIRLDQGNEFKILSFACSEIKTDQLKTRIITFENIKSELDEQEIQAWQKLIRVLTHEMMNSFSPIISANETLGMLLKSIEFASDKVINTDDLVKIEKLEKGIEIINERSKGITNFIEKYRQLTKLPKPVCQQVLVNKLLEETVILHEELLRKKKIKCVTEVYPENISLNVDHQLVIQVLINLFKNSVEALENTENPQINLKAKRDSENRIIITVSDNGCGIEKVDLNEIFIPFFTTKKDGSGIGLSLSKQIMHLHKGEINVSQKESETEFILIF